MAKKLIIWDFDGVIVDTATIGHEMHKPEIQDLTYDEFMAWFDGNAYTESAKFSHRFVETSFDSEAFYQDRLLELKANDSLHELIVSLSKRYMMAIITSSSGPTVEMYLKQHDLREYFTEVLGKEAGLQKTEKIATLLADKNTSPQDAVFITDTLGDLKEAAECHVRTVAVTWGFHDKERLIKGSPTAIVETPEELETVVRKILK